MNFTYTAWGAGEMVVQALRALALLGGSGILRGALTAAALLGLLLLAASAAFSMRLDAVLAPLRLLVAVAVSGGVLLQPATVTVVDEFDYDLLHGTTAPRTVVVADVPVGAALPAAYATRLGTAMTDLLETTLATPRQNLLNPSGMWLSARALRAMLQERPPRDPTLLGDFRYFLENCVYHDIRSGRIELDDLREGALLTELDKTSGGMTSIHRTADGGALVPLTCPQAWSGHGGVTGLRARIEREGVVRKIDGCQHLRGIALALTQQQLRRDRTAVQRDLNGRTSSCGDAVFNQALQTFGFGTGTLNEQFAELVAIGLFHEGVHLLTASAPNAMALGTFTATRQRNATFVLAGELAAAALPALRGILECVLLLLLPFLLILGLLFFDRLGSYLRNGLVLVLWLHLWPPVLTVVNHVGEWLQVAALNKHVILANGRFTAGGAAAVLEELDTQLALSRYMLVLVPMLAWALARSGEMGATMLANRFLQPGEGAASAAASNVATNNWRMDQVQLEPRTAVGPHVGAVGDPWGGVATQHEQVATMSLPANQPGYVGATSTRGITEALGRRAEEARSLTATMQTQFSEAVESAYAASFGREGVEALRALREQGVADTTSYRALQGYSTAASQGLAKSREIGQREDSSGSYDKRIDAGVDLGRLLPWLPLQFSAGVGGRFSDSVEVHEAMRRSYSQQDDATKSALEEVGQALESSGRSSLAASSGALSSESHQATMREAASRLESYSTAEQSAERLTVASEIARTSGQSVVHELAKDPRHAQLLEEFHRLRGAEGMPFEQAWAEAQRSSGVQIDLDDVSARLLASGLKPMPVKEQPSNADLRADHAAKRAVVEQQAGEVAPPPELQRVDAEVRDKQDAAGSRELPEPGDQHYQEERRLDRTIRGPDGEIKTVQPDRDRAGEALEVRDQFSNTEAMGISPNNPVLGVTGLRGEEYTEEPGSQQEQLENNQERQDDAAAKQGKP